jgi:hypothetical protein
LFTGPRNCGSRNRRRRWDRGALFLQDVRRVSFDRARQFMKSGHTFRHAPRSDQSYGGQPLVNRNGSRSSWAYPSTPTWNSVYTMKPIALSKQAKEAMPRRPRPNLGRRLACQWLFATNDCYPPVSIATAGFSPSLGGRSRTSMVSGTSASKRSRHIGRNFWGKRGKRCAGDRQGARRR